MTKFFPGFVCFAACITVAVLFISSVRAQEHLVSKNFKERLFQDWTFQDAGLNKVCFSDNTKNELEISMLGKVLLELEESGCEIFAVFNDELKKIIESKIPGSDPVWKEFYTKACKERRRIRLEKVRSNLPELVYAKHHVLGGSHYSYTEAPTDAQYPERRNIPGGKLLMLKIQEDGSTKEELLVETKEGLLRDPDVSYDGTRIVFSMRKHLEQDDFHLYDFDMKTRQTRQLTFGPGFADVEPCYLPDGNILFASTRCMQIVDCWWTDVVNFYVCDSEGRFMRRIGFDQVHTNYPQVLPDGRVLYTRWDYNDRGQIFPHGLFVMNYDGTGQTEYYGNNSYFPTSLLHGRGIPGSNKVVAIASGHHTHQRGKLVLIDRSKGTQENEGTTLIAPVRPSEVVQVDRYGQDGDQFQYPLAIDEENFIVAYSPEGFQGNRYNIPPGLYYMDIDNKKRELLAWDPAIACGQPVALQAKPIPMLRASSVDHSQEVGQYYVQDVYVGPGLEGIERGVVKELRIVALEFRAAGILSNGNSGLAGGALVSTPIAINNASWDVKRVLGTVPVEKDGSAYFEVPAKTPVYFQLLDNRGDVVQTMRSWSTLQPGELFSCVGCHEPKGATRNNPFSRGGSNRSLALRRAPKKPKPLDENFETETAANRSGFSFVRTIQPILDKHCIRCHTDGKNEDGSEAPFSLLGKKYEPTFQTVKHKDGREERRPDVAMAGRRFSESYVHLTKKGKPNDIVNWLNPQTGPPMLPPYFAGAAKSKLPKMFDNDSRDEHHRDVRISDLERRQLALWIDLLVPFSGSYTEEIDWTPRQKAEYAYYQMKRDRMSEIERENIEKLIRVERNEIPIPKANEFTKFEEGGSNYKKQFIEKFLKDSVD